MIVDFIGIKDKLAHNLNIFLRQEVNRRAPLLTIVGNKSILYEGDKTSYETVDRKKNNMPMQKVESNFTLTHEEMSKMTIAQIMEKIGELAEDIAGQMERGIFATLTQATEESGNVVKDTKPLSAETFLEGLAMIEIDFEDGLREKPQFPTMVLHPSQMEKLKKEEANETPERKQEIEARKNQILDKKYEEYLLRENNRKLVD